MAMAFPRLTTATTVAVLLLPAIAEAHSLVRPQGALLAYLSADATSLNTLEVSADGQRIAFDDRTVDGGMDFGSCDPGDVDRSGFVVVARCARAGVQTIRVDLGEREDSATVTAPVRTTLLGGPGADRLSGGPSDDQLDGGTGDDRLAGGRGNDVLVGALGGDQLDGGAGDDDLRARDGLADRVTCGEGTDTVDADQLDVVAADCERVTRTDVPPPLDAGADDRTAPQLELDADPLQRIGTTRTLRLRAASSERGAVATSGRIDIGDLSLPILTVRRAVAVAGGGVELRVVLARTVQRRALVALRKGRRVRVHLSVVATDVAGNSRLRRLPAITLKRA